MLHIFLLSHLLLERFLPLPEWESSAPGFLSWHSSTGGKKNPIFQKSSTNNIFKDNSETHCLLIFSHKEEYYPQQESTGYLDWVCFSVISCYLTKWKWKSPAKMKIAGIWVCSEKHICGRARLSQFMSLGWV